MIVLCIGCCTCAGTDAIETPGDEILFCGAHGQQQRPVAALPAGTFEPAGGAKPWTSV